MRLRRCTKFPSIFWIHVEEKSSPELAGMLVDEMTKILAEPGIYTPIIEYDMNAVLADWNFIKTMGSFARKHTDSFGTAYYIGMRGLRKIYFQMFTTIAGTKIKRVMLDRIQEVEPILGVNLKTDFEIVFESYEF